MVREADERTAQHYGLHQPGSSACPCRTCCLKSKLKNLQRVICKAFQIFRNNEIYQGFMLLAAP